MSEIGYSPDPDELGDKRVGDSIAQLDAAKAHFDDQVAAGEIAPLTPAEEAAVTVDKDGDRKTETEQAERPPQDPNLPKDIKAYVERKVGLEPGQEPSDKQKDTIATVYKRAEVFIKNIPELNKNVKDLVVRNREYPSALDSIDSIDTISDKAVFDQICEEITGPIHDLLKSQEFKKSNVDAYVQKMMTLAMDIAREQGVSPEEQVKTLKNITLEVQKAADMITYQDLCASRLTLGDHGWMHLIQDFRDATLIASGSMGDKLKSKHILMLGLAAAYHDTGYANPEVHNGQREGPQNYGSLDKGHPTTSAVYYRVDVQRRLVANGILNQEEADATYRMIINHENPELKAEAGSKYEELAYAFAIADAGAAFGLDKLPPSMQRPDVIQYAAWIAYEGKAKDTLKAMDESNPGYEEQKALVDAYAARVAQEKTTLIQDITEKYSAQEAQALVASLDHYGAKSMNFTLGRLSGEIAPPQVNSNGEIELRIFGGAGKAFDAKKYFAGAQEATAKLVGKMAHELGVLGLNDAQIDELKNFLIGKADTLSDGIQGKLTVSTDANGVVSLRPIDSRLVIMYDAANKLDDSENGFIPSVDRALEKTRDAKIELEQKVQAEQLKQRR